MKVINSQGAIAKVAKYSLVGISSLSMVETIANVVLLPFKLIAKIFVRKKEAPKVPESTNKNWRKVAIGVAVGGVALAAACGLAYYLRSSGSVVDTVTQAVQNNLSSSSVVDTASQAVLYDLSNCDGFRPGYYINVLMLEIRDKIMSQEEYGAWANAWRAAKHTCKPLGIFKGTHLENVQVAREFIKDGKLVKIFGLL